jgi:hypothetical protein
MKAAVKFFLCRVVTKFPLVAGFFALILAVGSLLGIRELGAGSTAALAKSFPVLTDCLFWLGVLCICLVVLALYSLLLVKLGLVPGEKPLPGSEQPQEGATGAECGGATVH